MDNKYYEESIMELHKKILDLIDKRNDVDKKHRIDLSKSKMKVELITIDSHYFEMEIPLSVNPRNREMGKIDIVKFLENREINIIKLTFNLYDNESNYKENHFYFITNSDFHKEMDFNFFKIENEFLIRFFISIQYLINEQMNISDDKILMININGEKYTFYFNKSDEVSKESTRFKFLCNNLIIENLLTHDNQKTTFIIPIYKISKIFFQIILLDAE